MAKLTREVKDLVEDHTKEGLLRLCEKNKKAGIETMVGTSTSCKPRSVKAGFIETVDRNGVIVIDDRENGYRCRINKKLKSGALVSSVIIPDATGSIRIEKRVHKKHRKGRESRNAFAGLMQVFGEGHMAIRGSGRQAIGAESKKRI
ncbi:uncharacterized protein EV422DRAFT_507180 [Fimicolochytrium jonesii]|uniref:uncharacterized protein n=1 Tax=Fimicolochytrium jonesii TaxID=1396493 RepID=UPI0022FE66C7|nr:uncharacterized protein EV422DRAFT_507180 [Fimicolochytrium jonesii]KAI8820029.1 hypothetical protein EV422DRAFT_507180 [Fimicolochytrium jonesii]